MYLAAVIRTDAKMYFAYHVQLGDYVASTFKC